MAMIAKTAKWSQSTAGVTVRLQVGGPVSRCECTWAGRVTVIEQIGAWGSFLSICDENGKLAVTHVNQNYYWIKFDLLCDG